MVPLIIKCDDLCSVFSEFTSDNVADVDHGGDHGDDDNTDDGDHGDDDNTVDDTVHDNQFNVAKWKVIYCNISV